MTTADAQAAADLCLDALAAQDGAITIAGEKISRERARELLADALARFEPTDPPPPPPE